MDSPSLDEALRRLASALDLLEAATARRVAAEAARADLTEELAVMQDDRARLALDLDAALARAKRLEATGQQVSRRIEKASASIRALIEGAGRG
jgi:chromosome segregation ATPase